jgi:hypothetical protein
MCVATCARVRVPRRPPPRAPPTALVGRSRKYSKCKTINLRAKRFNFCVRIDLRTYYTKFSTIALDMIFKNRRGLRRPNTDPAPFVFCEFCKSMQTHENAPQEPEKQMYRNPKVHRSGVWCAAECCIKFVSWKVYFARARAARARCVGLFNCYQEL